MSSPWQTAAALALVALAVAWLAWRSLARRGRPGCGGDCGCPAAEMKATLQAKAAVQVPRRLP
jgi:hypothetical protein